MQASDLSAVDIAYKLRTGRIDAQQIIDDHLASIHTSEPQLHVWEMLDEAKIRKQASHLKTELPLSGVPVGVKDIIDCADMPCRWGSALFQSRIPDKDAQVITRLKAAGALILGKTRTTEFAYLQYCQTRNPHDFAYSPGGVFFRLCSRSGCWSYACCARLSDRGFCYQAGSLLRCIRL